MESGCTSSFVCCGVVLSVICVLESDGIRGETANHLPGKAADLLDLDKVQTRAGEKLAVGSISVRV